APAAGDRRRGLSPAATRRGRLHGLWTEAAEAPTGPVHLRPDVPRPAHRRAAVRLRGPLREQRVLRQLRGRVPARPEPGLLRAIRELPGADALLQGPAAA